MKDTLTDANFPRTADQRVYHLGTRPGEVANRIVTVGSPSRAHKLGSLLDPHPKPFILSSERGFLTITGKYQGTPISIISIGMGYPNVDFFIREVRECIAGDILIVRLGSCGALVDAPVGSVVVPKSSVAVYRNVDFDFSNPDADDGEAYHISKPVLADPQLHEALGAALEAVKPPTSKGILNGTTNASADSFYSSQGRQTSFPDHNQDLIEKLAVAKGVSTLEMETFHIFHLASCWSNRARTPRAASPAPLTTGPVNPQVSSSASAATGSTSVRLAAPSTKIRAAAAQMVFAARLSKDFITPEEVTELEEWTSKGALEGICAVEVDVKQLHPEEGSVWATV